MKSHTWKKNIKFLQTIATQRAHKLHAICLLIVSFFSLKKPEQIGLLIFLLLGSNRAKMKLIFISTSNSFWVLRCHTRVTGAGENGTFLRYWQANNIFKIKLLGVGSSTCQNIAWSEVLVTQSCLTLWPHGPQHARQEIRGLGQDSGWALVTVPGRQ